MSIALTKNKFILIYRIFLNLIRTSFCRFLKRKEKLVCNSNPHLSFTRPLPTRQTDWIILVVTIALTVIQLTRRVWSSDWVMDNDWVMCDDGESDE